jgi:cytochrome c-type biogenesis protein CcmH/NrfG
MSSNKWILLATGFVAGLIVGVVLMNVFSGPSGGGSVSSAPAPVTPGAPQQGPDKLQLSRSIAQLQEMLKKDPNNYQALVQLGNDNFDIGAAPASIDAYRRAPAIKDDDPNVWTDLGVMYREVKDFQQAVKIGRAHV